LSGAVLALKCALLAAGLWYAACFLRVVAGRVTSPFENEWLEGDEFHHALRILSGQTWYPPPSIEFFPNVYPPGYALVCAIVMRLFGPSLTAMRCVSLAGTAAACGGMFYSVRRTAGASNAAIAVGLFLATFRVCGAWFDLARVDMLALGSVLVAVALLDRGLSHGTRLLAVALLAAACFVKQTAFAFLVPVLVLELATDLRRGLRAVLVATVLLAVPAWLLQASSSGWFSFYSWTLPSTTPRDPARMRAFFTTDLPALMGGALIVATAAAPLLRRAARAPLPLLLLPPAILASLSPRSNPGGYANDLIFASSFLAMAVALGLGQLAAHRRWVYVLPLAQILVLTQLASLAWAVGPQIPTEADTLAGLRAVEKIRSLPGPVLIPKHPYLLYLAGLPMHAQIRSGWASSKRAARLIAQRDATIDVPGALAAGIKSGRWGAFVASEGEPAPTDLETLAREYYRPAGELVAPGEGDALFPLTGHRVRPSTIYLRAPTE
jgi:4-amino-4-deoxy-L-arabinose transferase-like glycosyltransferase